jgi:hypothetical protein
MSMADIIEAKLANPVLEAKTRPSFKRSRYA